MRYLVAAIFLLLALSAGVALGQSAPWRTVASGNDVSAYYATAHASADITAPHALALRNAGSKPAKLSYFFTCTSGDVTVQPGRTLAVDPSTAKSCSLSGDITIESGGKARVELLRR